MSTMHRLVQRSVVLLIGVCFASTAAADSLEAQAAKTLRRATQYFRDKVSSNGGYLWRYSEDLRLREGEGKASVDTVWIQPPGTPSVGMAYLDAYDGTGDTYYLDAARDVGKCLVRGQLRSGGWDYRIEFNPAQRKRYGYRVDSGQRGTRNTTTLDDNTTQAALRMLMRLDKTLQFKDKPIHDAAEFALASLLKAQYPNGAWPQRFDRFPIPSEHPVKKASYPDSWSRTHPEKNYRGFYTFNDNAIADVIDVMFIAERTYEDMRYREAAERAGGFVLLAQMPEPQPAWAQQYDADMHPAWARRFEPPSITGGESQGVMRTLLRLYRDTGDKKYLQPLPRAIEYLRGSQLNHGRLARFYELKTNRPLYFTRKYVLTYDDGDLPTHYGFKVGSKLDSIEREYKRLVKLAPDQLGPPKSSAPRLSKGLEQQARTVINSLDKQGRWVEDGRMRNYSDVDRVIDSRTFVRNIEILSRYLAARR